MMDLGKLPIVDFKLANSLIGNKTGIAEELLGFLLLNLPTDLRNIKKEYLTQNYGELRRKVHKLHGAVCYCGVPRLKTVLMRLETDLKNNIMDDSHSLLELLDKEVKLLLERYSYLIPTSRKNSKA